MKHRKAGVAFTGRQHVCLWGPGLEGSGHWIWPSDTGAIKAATKRSKVSRPGKTLLIVSLHFPNAPTQKSRMQKENIKEIRFGKEIEDDLIVQRRRRLSRQIEHLDLEKIVKEGSGRSSSKSRKQSSQWRKKEHKLWLSKNGETGCRSFSSCGSSNNDNNTNKIYSSGVTGKLSREAGEKAGAGEN